MFLSVFVTRAILGIHFQAAIGQQQQRPDLKLLTLAVHRRVASTPSVETDKEQHLALVSQGSRAIPISNASQNVQSIPTVPSILLASETNVKTHVPEYAESMLGAPSRATAPCVDVIRDSLEIPSLHVTHHLQLLLHQETPATQILVVQMRTLL